MSTFKWKRKIGERVQHTKTFLKFSEESESDVGLNDHEDVDWLTATSAKRNKAVHLEDGFSKSARLKNEGCVLAEAGRFREAVGRWDDALTYTPNDETLFEMKAQAELQVSEVFDAVQSAEKAAGLKSTWWPALQTLGRAQMAMGEVDLAVKSFSKAIHLYPGDREMWDEDLKWAVSVKKTLRQLKLQKEEASRRTEETKLKGSVRIEEVEEDVPGTLVKYASSPLNRPLEAPHTNKQFSFNKRDYIRVRL